MARDIGFEPMTFSFQKRYADQTALFPAVDNLKMLVEITQ